MDIAVETPDTGDIAALLEYHVAAARAATPIEFSFALPGNALMADEVTFWTAREEGALMGFAALKDLSDGSGEVKSMRTAPAYLRRSVARRLLGTVIAVARERGYHTLYLETGFTQEYLAARKLYEAFGFAPCGPFADYEASKHNLYMKLSL